MPALFSHNLWLWGIFFGQPFSSDAYEQMLPINTYGKGTFFFSNHSSSMTTVLHLSWASASQDSFCYVGHLLTMRSFFFHMEWSHLFSCKTFVSRNSFTQCTLYDVKVSPRFPPKLKKNQTTRMCGHKSKGSSVFSIYTSWQIVFSEWKREKLSWISSTPNCHRWDW